MFRELALGVAALWVTGKVMKASDRSSATTEESLNQEDEIDPSEYYTSSTSRHPFSLAHELSGTNIFDPMIAPPQERLPEAEIQLRRAAKKANDQANAVIYRPVVALKKHQREIRVLILEPSQVHSAPIVCKMVKESLHKGMKCEALSYTWSDPREREYIAINDEVFVVSRDLLSALQHLRLDNIDRYLWIDAICMNQNDYSEMKWHLTIMRDIYSNARRTLIWLGESSIESIYGINHFNSVGSRIPSTIPALITDYHSNPEAWRCLVDILERRWWSRLWIVQEVIVSENADIICGDSSIAFTAIATVVGIAIKYGFDIFGGYPHISQYARNANLLQHFRSNWSEDSSPCFEWWVRIFGLKHGCENPLDKVRALVALSADREHRQLADLHEEESAVELYTKITTYILQSSQPYPGKDIDFICLGRGPRRNQNFGLKPHEPKLPSWVPDLTITPWESYASLTRTAWLSRFPRQFKKKGDEFHASFPIEKLTPAIHTKELGEIQGIKYTGLAEVTFSNDGQKLKLAGAFVDTVEGLTAAYHLEMNRENVRTNAFTEDQIAQHLSIGQHFFALWRQQFSRSNDQFMPAYPRGGSYSEALVRLTCCDKTSQHKRWTEQDRQNWQDDRDAELKDPLNMFVYRNHRRMMLSAGGLIGLVPPETEQGDSIFILYGCSVPVILRPKRNFGASGKKSITAEFIGECYVHGIMDGEIVRDVHEGRNETIEICLV